MFWLYIRTTRKKFLGDLSPSSPTRLRDRYGHTITCTAKCIRVYNVYIVYVRFARAEIRVGNNRYTHCTESSARNINTTAHRGLGNRDSHRDRTKPVYCRCVLRPDRRTNCGVNSWARNRTSRCRISKDFRSFFTHARPPASRVFYVARPASFRTDARNPMFYFVYTAVWSAPLFNPVPSSKNTGFLLT